MTGEHVMWTVERGEYSDHRVMCVCATEEQAKEVAAAYNGGEDAGYEKAFVGTLPVVAEPRRITVYSLTVNVWDDGTTSNQVENMDTWWAFDMLYPHYAQPVTWRWVRAPVHHGKGGRLEVAGTDLERVRRVFSDRRAQLLAEDALRRKREHRG